MFRWIYSLSFAAYISSYAQPLLAQAANEPPARDQGLQIMMTLGMAVVFGYFVLWRPERKKQKALLQQREGLKAGDRVVAMGILGTVLSIKEHSVILRMYDGAKIEVLKAAVSDVQANAIVEEEKV